MSYSRTEEILREALIKAKQTIKEQEEALEQLLQAPTTRGYVVSTNYGKILVSAPGGVMAEVATPYKDVGGKHLLSKIKNGAVVRLMTDPTLAIIDVLEGNQDYTGDIVLATQNGKNGEVEIDIQGSTRLVRFNSDVKAPEIGDRLLLDPNACVAIRNLGPDESKFALNGITGVSWDQIGGLETAKEALKEAIELPFKHPELYKKYNKKPVKGILLYGPPGCGKTMLAKATATSLSKIHSKTLTDTSFIYVKGPEMLDKYVGNTEAQVRSLFARARKHYKKNGYPAVIFIDEADALLGGRGSRPHMGIESTVVPQFLSEMDGLDESGAMVLLATNRPDTLDSAVTRDGRIDRKVRVTRPDQEGAEEIFNLYLKGRPIEHAMGEQSLAKQAAEYLFGDHQFYTVTTHNGEVSFKLSHLVNGALIAGVVESATTLALRRELSGEPTKGISMQDIRQAVDMKIAENAHLNHEEEMKEFVELHNLSVKEISKVQHQA